MRVLHALLSATIDAGHWLDITSNSETSVVRVMSAPSRDGTQKEICRAHAPKLEEAAAEAFARLALAADGDQAA